MQKLCLTLSLIAAFAARFVLEPSQSQTGTTRAEASAPSVTSSLRSLGWLAGTWRHADGDSVLEETWSVPEGDSICGMFRWLGAGKPSLYELFAVEVEDGQPVFRIRHFHPGLRPWDSELEALESYPLTESGPTSAVFENPTAEDVRRFVYRLEESVLHVRVELVKGDPYVFAFQRAPAPEAHEPKSH